jgi:hypothetical protein
MRATEASGLALLNAHVAGRQPGNGSKTFAELLDIASLSKNSFHS